MPCLCCEAIADLLNNLGEGEILLRADVRIDGRILRYTRIVENNGAVVPVRKAIADFIANDVLYNIRRKP